MDTEHAEHQEEHDDERESWCAVEAEKPAPEKPARVTPASEAADESPSDIHCDDPNSHLDHSLFGA